jgi:subtilisin family serine protease
MDETDNTGQGRARFSRRRLLQSVPLGGMLGLAGGSGTAAQSPQQFVVRATEASPPSVGDTASVEQQRKRSAEAAQQPLFTYASGRTGIEIRRSFWLLDGALVEIDPQRVDPMAIQAVEGVEWIHENRQFHVPETRPVTPAAHGSRTYGLDQIGAPSVWDEFDTRGSGASVAVIDTGVDPAHPDIDIQPGNFAAFDADGNEIADPEVRDTSFHGTHVSGTVVGGDASGRHIGVAPDATLYHALGLPDGTGTFAQIVAALEWAVESGVDVANLSLGAPGFIAEFLEPIRNTVAAGTVVVASAGNDGEGVVSTPGAVLESLAVGATNADGEIAEFSGGQVVDTGDAWGRDAPDTWPESYVLPDVAAPGVAVRSAFPEGVDPPPGGDPVGDQWLELSGTSMAAPHVAGTVALMTAASQAVPDSFDPEQTVRALSTTATKPAERPDQDPRYGEGVVDAPTATSRVAAQRGVEGVVTGPDGAPVADGTVSLDGFPVDTGTDGSYRIRAQSGSYTVEADGFGFARTERAVDVADGFTTADFLLDRTVDVAVAAGQPDGIDASEAFSVAFEIANVDAYTVELKPGFQGDLSLTVNGQSVAPGESVSLEETATELALTVDPSAGASGDLVLEHSFEGSDGAVTQTTGPTAVFAEFIDVAVVDRENGDFTEDLAGLLQENLGLIFEVSVMTPQEALAAAEDGSVGGFVVQSLGSDEDLIETFVAETAIPQLGVVYLQQVGGTEDLAEEGRAADGIHKRSEATGDPQTVVDTAVEGANPPVEYDITDESHPIVENAGVSGSVTLYEAFPVQFFGAFHSYFEGFDGEINAETIATVSAGPAVGPNPGLAVDDLSRTVLAASLGFSEFVGRRVFQPGAVDLLTSATEFAATSPRVSVLSGQPDRIDPGETIELQITARELLSYELELGEGTTLSEVFFEATLNGEEIEFGESVDLGGFTGELTLRVTVPRAEGHQISLSHRFVVQGRRGDRQTTTAETGPTAFYTPPLDVPDHVETITDAVDIVAEGGEIAVEDGVYDERAPAAPEVGLLIDTPGVTLRAREGAEPSIRHAEDRTNPSIVAVTADGVTVEGFEINAVDGTVDERNTTASALTVTAGTSDVTACDLTVAGTFGVQIEGGTAGLTVENVTARQTVLGVGTSSSGSGAVEDATIKNVTVTDRPETAFRGGIILDTAASGISITDCSIDLTDDETGIGLVGPLGGGRDCQVSNNSITLADGADVEGSTGIYVDEIDTAVSENVVDGPATGIQISDLGFGEEAIEIRDNDIAVTDVGVVQFGDHVKLLKNTIEASTGIKLGDDPDEFAPVLVAADAVLARDNDLEATDLPFAGQPDDGFGDPSGPFDCRRNYLGERGYDDQITEGAVAYDPFLTAPPAALDQVPPRALGTDCLLDPSTPYGLGIPGPTDQSIWDVLGVDNAEDFFGEVAAWDRSTGEFRQVRDEGEIQTLGGFRVTPATGVRATISFQQTDPGDGTGSAAREVQQGRNFVCAPAYGSDAVFESGTADIDEVETGLVQPPRQQVGPDEGPAPEDGANRSAFTAYFVDVASEGTIDPSIAEQDPTMVSLLDALGLDRSIHTNPGKPPAGAATESPSLSAVKRGRREDEPPHVRAVMAVIADRLLAARLDSDSTVETLDQTLDSLRDEVDSPTVLKRAASRLLAQFYGIRVGDADDTNTE